MSFQIEIFNHDDLMEMEIIEEEDASTPKDLRSLLFKDLTNIPSETVRPARKRLNLEAHLNDSPVKAVPEKISPGLDRSIMEISSPAGRGGKEVQLRTQSSPVLSPTNPEGSRVSFLKAHSYDEVKIEKALARSSSEAHLNLIGDFSRSHSLPVVVGRFPERKSISAETLCKLLEGGFRDQIASFEIVDCRFPYEYEGGHIFNALNLFTEKQLIERFFFDEETRKAEVGGQPNILVFHCEFSQKRGPALLALLRKHDRQVSPYPALRYPEIYLLDGGYKQFFHQYPGLCNPSSYRQMLDPNYADECRSLMSNVKSKSKKRSRFF